MPSVYNIMSALCIFWTVNLVTKIQIIKYLQLLNNSNRIAMQDDET